MRRRRRACVAPPTEGGAAQRAAREVGAREAAALLQDWLVLFTAAYNRSLRRGEAGDAGGPSAASQARPAGRRWQTRAYLARLTHAGLPCAV